MNFPNEAPTPTAATFHEVVHYFFNENERRAAESVDGLRESDVNHDPGHGAWSIGMILKHQVQLIGLMTNNLKPGSVEHLEAPDLGSEGAWNLENLLSYRKDLADRFIEVFDSLPEEEFMTTRPGVYPPHWEEWPALMRMLRPLLDMSTHIGQVNYARRQRDNPINSGTK